MNFIAHWKMFEFYSRDINHQLRFSLEIREWPTMHIGKYLNSIFNPLGNFDFSDSALGRVLFSI